MSMMMMMMMIYFTSCCRADNRRISVKCLDRESSTFSRRHMHSVDADYCCRRRHVAWSVRVLVTAVITT